MSLIICFNDRFFDTNNHAKGCHLRVKKYHQSPDGLLQEVLSKEVVMPPEWSFGAVSAPSITWTENSSQGRLVAAFAAFRDIYFFRLRQGDFQVATSEVASRTTVQTSQNVSLSWQVDDKLASIAYNGAFDMGFVESNLPDPVHPDWGGWPNTSVRVGRKDDQVIKSSLAPSSIEVPAGAGSMWALYTREVSGTASHKMSIAVLDRESYKRALTSGQNGNLETRWSLYHFEDQFRTTDSFSAVFDEQDRVVHMVYRGTDDDVLHLVVQLDEYGVPVATQQGNSYIISPRQQNIPKPDKAGPWRAPKLVMFHGRLYAIWQRAGDNKLVYAFAEKNGDAWKWSIGGVLDITIHDELSLWGFGACYSPMN